MVFDRLGTFVSHLPPVPITHPRPPPYKLPPLHRLLCILDTQIIAHTNDLQTRPQTTSQMDQLRCLSLIPTSHDRAAHLASSVPTPYSSHAFNPVDGYLQSVPYHIFIFLFPLHRLLYLGLFVFVNCWSIFVRPRFSRSIATRHPTLSPIRFMTRI